MNIRKYRYSKLKWTFEDIRTRLGENELFEILTPDHHLQLNGLTSEKVSFLLKLLPDKSEASMLRVKKPTSGMPLLSLRLYDELPDVHNRILSIEYWYRFRDIAMDLERSAYYVLKAAEVRSSIMFQLCYSNYKNIAHSNTTGTGGIESVQENITNVTNDW